MTTPIDEVNDLFLSLVDDYRLTSLYTTSGSDALNTYLESVVLFSIAEFEPLCIQDLAYDSGSMTFYTTLTQTTKLILARIMVKYWLQKQVQDTLQMRLSLQNRDFKHFSEAQNLAQKQQLYLAKCEEISQMLLDYGYRNSVNWADWANQDFG